MLTSCPDSELDKISTSFIDFPVNVEHTLSPALKEQRVMLSIANLKRYLLTDGHTLVKWSFSTFLARFNRIQKDIKKPFTPLERALLDFLTSCLSFLEATNNSALGLLFEMVNQVYQELPHQAISILVLVSDDIPESVVTTFHHYLITRLADTGNPITDDKVDDSGVKKFGCSVWNSLYKRHKSLVRDSVMDLLNSYLVLLDKFTNGDNDAMVVDDEQHNSQRYTLGYIMALPLISDLLTNECWPGIFRRLYENNRIGTLLLFERDTGYSWIQTTSGELVKIIDIFPMWLSNVAFVPDGVIMKHALDIAVVVDTVVYDYRLELQHLLPSDGHSIMDNFLPSLTNSGITSASIDLVDEWILPLLDPGSHQQQKYKRPRESHQLKIPVFFLKLALLKDNTLESALELLIKLMSHLPITTGANTNRYLLLTMIETVEATWPSFFSTMLEQLFSKAMALNLTGNDEDFAKVETIFGNLVILSGDTAELPPIPSFIRHSFTDYISSHCTQVMLLFINHPSNTCRAMGYRTLSHSKFWEQDHQLQASDISTMCKLFSDSWFRLLRTRYTFDDDGTTDEKLDLALVELQNLVTQCCSHGTTSHTMISTLLDAILNGYLETFPRTDLAIDSSKTAFLLGRITQDHSPTGSRLSQSSLGIPRYIPNIEVLKQDLNIKDTIYMDNIKRTANIFKEASIKASDVELFHIIKHKLPVLSPLSSKTYDDALPHRIPYAHDITNGCAFKDHPALFLIMDHCVSMPLVRSVFIYFITFWNMTEVASKPTSLYFATQLEGTMHLLQWMEQMLPKQFQGIGAILPYMSGQDVGHILYKVIWPCVRYYYDSSPTIIDDLDPYLQAFKIIYEHRKQALTGSQHWAAALTKTVIDLNLVV
ncbi:hypothetical protein BC941DRAFT_436666 [Chlamydoabsidia padenii]|nr:hypothetical protein BC941DRAFT_436666 [Chlamydoabsidia padenii]